MIIIQSHPPLTIGWVLVYPIFDNTFCIYVDNLAEDNLADILITVLNLINNHLILFINLLKIVTTMKLIVTAFEPKEGKNYEMDNLLMLSSNDPEYASLMVVNTVESLVNGYFSFKKKIGFITGETEALKQMLSNSKIKNGTDLSNVIGDHKIITVEKLASEVEDNQGFRPKINPETKKELTKDGEVIVWKTLVVSSSSDQSDEYVTHDKAEVVASKQKPATVSSSDDLPY